MKPSRLSAFSRPQRTSGKSASLQLIGRAAKGTNSQNRPLALGAANSHFEPTPVILCATFRIKPELMLPTGSDLG